MSVRKVGALGFGMTNFKEVLEGIDKAIAERYVFSNEELPWKQKYRTATGEALAHSAPTFIYEDGMVPHRTRLYQTMRLLNEAHSMLVERRYILAMSYSTHPPVMTQL